MQLGPVYIFKASPRNAGHAWRTQRNPVYPAVGLSVPSFDLLNVIISWTHVSTSKIVERPDLEAELDGELGEESMVKRAEGGCWYEFEYWIGSHVTLKGNDICQLKGEYLTEKLLLSLASGGYI